MSRRVCWFSCGAASAVAAKIAAPDVIAYCETGSEDKDNNRFLIDCEKWYEKNVLRLRNEKYSDTWDVWVKRRYIAGIQGAPCTSELKIEPRLAFQQPGDIHIFGYTADANDVRRAAALRENWPDLKIETPLIERGITKAGCLSMIMSAGIKPPRVYEMGFPNANCIPCCKAQSPAYWALVRMKYPREFERMAMLSREMGARLAVICGERIYIDDIPENQAVTEPIAPECDFLCSIAEQEIMTPGRKGAAA